MIRRFDHGSVPLTAIRATRESIQVVIPAQAGIHVPSLACHPVPSANDWQSEPPLSVA
jgi:hypothetical protein